MLCSTTSILEAGGAGLYCMDASSPVRAFEGARRHRLPCAMTPMQPQATHYTMPTIGGRKTSRLPGSLEIVRQLRRFVSRGQGPESLPAGLGLWSFRMA